MFVILLFCCNRDGVIKEIEKRFLAFVIWKLFDWVDVCLLFNASKNENSSTNKIKNFFRSHKTKNSAKVHFSSKEENYIWTPAVITEIRYQKTKKYIFIFLTLKLFFEVVNKMKKISALGINWQVCRITVDN